ncbi:MAG: Gfo/Idh/MocA family oxidoreductase [Pseudomonadota bacterium]
MLKTGIVGAGVFGGFHAQKYAASHDADIVAVFDPDHDRAAGLAEAHGARSFSSYDDFLDAVDALTIAAPADVHFPLGMHAIERGRHVYMEKPLALRADHAEALSQAASRQGVVLQVGHQERVVLDAIGLFARNVRPHHLEFTRCGPASGRGEDVSVVFDLMIHDLDLAAYLIGSDLRRASAAGDDHDVAATLDFVGGASASFLASRRCDKRERFMRAVYDDGVIEFDFIERRIQSSCPAGSVRPDAVQSIQDPLGISVSWFLNAVRQRTGVRISGDDAAEAVRLAERVEASRLALVRETMPSVSDSDRLTA